MKELLWIYYEVYLVEWITRKEFWIITEEFPRITGINFKYFRNYYWITIETASEFLERLTERFTPRLCASIKEWIGLFWIGCCNVQQRDGSNEQIQIDMPHCTWFSNIIFRLNWFSRLSYDVTVNICFWCIVCRQHEWCVQRWDRRRREIRLLAILVLGMPMQYSCAPSNIIHTDGNLSCTSSVPIAVERPESQIRLVTSWTN